MATQDVSSAGWLVSMRAASWNVERLDAGSMTAMEAGRTAVLVCQGRAAADGRIAVGRFGDPVAITMLHDGGRVPVDRVRAGTPPQPHRWHFAAEQRHGSGGPAFKDRMPRRSPRR